MLQRKLCIGQTVKESNMRIGANDVKELFCIVVSGYITTVVFTCMLGMALAIKAVNSIFGLFRRGGSKDVY